MQLIILGMHRSGTSVLARLLNMMGAYFGPEGLSLGANIENPTGFWERQDVADLNKAILRALGCEWNTVLGFNTQALPGGEISDFQKKASRILLEMDSHRPWVLKDPRLCMTFPVWEPLLEVPICIHVFRNPIEVAKSLKTRNQIPIDIGISLWELYSISAISASRNLPRVFISHQGLMTNPVLEVKRLYEALLELDVRGLSRPSDREINSFVRSNLYREKADDSDASRRLNANQKEIIEEFKKGNASNNRWIPSLSNSSISALKIYEQLEKKRRDEAVQVEKVKEAAEAGVDKAVTQKDDVVRKEESGKLHISRETSQEEDSARKAGTNITPRDIALEQQLEQQRKEFQKTLKQEEMAAIIASEGRVRAEIKDLLQEQQDLLEESLREIKSSIEQTLASAAEVVLKREVEFDEQVKRRRTDFEQDLAQKEAALERLREDVKGVEKNLDQRLREKSDALLLQVSKKEELLSKGYVQDKFHNAIAGESAAVVVEADHVSKEHDNKESRGSNTMPLAKWTVGRAVSLIKRTFLRNEHRSSEPPEENQADDSSTLETMEAKALGLGSLMRLIYALESRTWFLRHESIMYALVEKDAITLAHYLVADVVSRACGPIGVARVEVNDLQVNIQIDGRKGSKTLLMDRSEADTTPSFAFDPCPWTDSWLPVKFDITIRGRGQLRLRTYLPESEDLPSKGFTISRGGERLASGELARGSLSAIHIGQSGEVSRWEDICIELGYAEPLARDDERELGLVLVGIDRVAECDVESNA